VSRKIDGENPKGKAPMWLASQGTRGRGGSSPRAEGKRRKSPMKRKKKCRGGQGQPLLETWKKKDNPKMGMGYNRGNQTDELSAYDREGGGKNNLLETGPGQPRGRSSGNERENEEP